MCEARIYLYLILIGLLCSVSEAKKAQKIKFPQEDCIVAMLPGEGPGQYFHHVGAGEDLCPRCFAIDPNDGAFYIPEVDRQGNIRLHKFDRSGNFVRMLKLKLEGQAYLVSGVAVGSNGDIYMCVNRLLQEAAEDCICRYNRQGKLLNMFGPKGPITKADLEAERKAKEKGREIPTREKYFWGGGDIFMLSDEQVLFIQNYFGSGGHSPDTFRFDGRSGRLLEYMKENRSLPKEIAHIRDSHLKKLEVLIKADNERKRITARVYSLIGPDGLFYYMSVEPERLEIRRVLFYK